jgi:hypothetical protein
MFRLSKERQASLRRELFIAAISVLIIGLVTLVACGGQPVVSSAPEPALVLDSPVGTSAQATIDQSAATAEVARVNALATLNSANATLSAAQTQDQNIANVDAAHIAATAAIVRANAQATLNSAGSTQNAAQTLAQYDLQSTESQGTQAADATLVEQNKNDLAAGTQTAAANSIATQTRAAAATSQGYADQARRQVGSVAFLWIWCLPVFLVLLAGLLLWGVWRWLKIEQANQRILEEPVDELPPPTVHVIPPQPGNPSKTLEDETIDRRYRLTKPDDRVRRWVDEVKHKLQSSERKDEDDHTDD